MKKFFGKKMIATAVLGVTLFGGMTLQNAVHAETQNTTVAVNVQVQQETKSAVNWTKGAEADITATGTGLPREAGPRGAALARRAAIVDAYRYLAEAIEGVQVDADTVMQDLVIQSDTVRTRVSALIRGAKIIEEHANADGSYSVTMSIPMYGSNSVASIAIPEIQKNVTPTPLPTVNLKETVLPRQEVKAVKSATFTGIIVDESGLGLEATFSPVIYDENGRGIYGMKNINPDFAISKGMVEYATNRDQAVANSRAGASPLVVKAVAVKGGTNSVNKVNVVVSASDGDKILLANEKSGMLQNCSVVFVK